MEHSLNFNFVSSELLTTLTPASVCDCQLVTEILKSFFMTPLLTVNRMKLSTSPAHYETYETYETVKQKSKIFFKAFHKCFKTLTSHEDLIHSVN